MEIKFDPKKGVWTEDPETVERLRRNWIGELEKGKGRIWLEPEEALYAMNILKMKCLEGKREMDFNQMAGFYMPKVENLFVRYNAYRDWRDRGLVIKMFREVKGTKKAEKRYPAKKIGLKKLKASALWYPDSMFSVLLDEKTGKQLFEKHWFGQYGIYKQQRGDVLKLTFLETIFLAKRAGLKIVDRKGKTLNYGKILSEVTKKREWTKQLYEVYSDWREKGFVVKTGFKFGTHFRIYFPGASPVGEYTHSRHVLHVFPPEQKLLISEWARAVRVAHGVKKTFILAIPKLKKYPECKADFLAYRRKKEKNVWVRETPEDRPRYLVAALSEDEHMGGVELASLLNKANRLGLELILSITDRETSITYYILKKIQIASSKYEYYEIEWMKP